MTSHIVEAVQPVAEDSLRIVASIESFDHEIEYVRDDLEGKFSGEQFEEIAKYIITEGLAGRDIGTLSQVGT